MRTLVTLAILAATLGTATAGGLVPVNGQLDGAVADDGGRGIADLPVRLVGDAVVVTLRTDARGNFHATGMPVGVYRVEVARGWIREVIPVTPQGIRIDRGYIRCCLCAMTARTFDPGPPLRTGHVELSTTQGVRLGARDLR